MIIETRPLAGKQVQEFVTETCNLKCKYCPYPDQTPEQKKLLKSHELSVLQWREINNKLYLDGGRMFCIIGGEPASYAGVAQVISDITVHNDAFVLLSTSGIHLLHNDKLRKSVGEALAQPYGRQFKNGIAISCDVIPPSGKLTVEDSRALKAQQGIDFVRKMQQEFPGLITYVANVMVTPENLTIIPTMQDLLENLGIYINLCTKQGKCFGEKEAIFNQDHLQVLNQLGVEMIKRKMDGKLVVNSAAYFSQFPGVIGMEDYHCWEQKYGHPVIDIGPDGKFRYCN